jgi:ankyrin repeat protein
MISVEEADLAEQKQNLAWQLGWELHKYARLQQRDALKDLLKTGGAYCGAPDVLPALNWQDENGTSALWWVCVHGDDELVRLLLAAGADPNCADKDSWTPVSLASRCGHDDCLRLLIEAGAELSVPVSDGDTALDKAIFWENDECERLLRERGGASSRFGLEEPVSRATVSPNPNPAPSVHLEPIEAYRAMQRGAGVMPR